MAGILLEGNNVTDEQRAAHARKMSEDNRAKALVRMAEIKARGGGRKLAEAERLPGAVLDDQVVPAGGHYSHKVAAGNTLRIIDLEGRQAVDFLCYELDNPENRYNAANTIKFNRSIYIGQGFKLYSDLGDVLMTVEADTVGWHDTIGGCCSSEANYVRYGVKDTPSCRNNFISALAEHGMGPRDIPANINFFMYVPVRDDGSTEIVEGMSEPGDFVDVSAQKDVLVAISNCPQVFNPCNGWNPTPIRVIEWCPGA
jgi:uncharacterized protein